MMKLILLTKKSIKYILIKILLIMKMTLVMLENMIVMKITLVLKSVAKKF